MDTDEGRLDYEYELGNGWSRHQLLVLTELKRLADHSERMEVMQHEHTTQFAVLGEQNRRRDEVLTTLVKEVRTLRKDHDGLAIDSTHSRVKLSFTTKVASVAVGVLAWCAMFGISIYSVFFHGTPPTGR